MASETVGLMAALIRNRNSRALNRDMTGFALDIPERVVDRVGILAYAKATGDDNPAYTGEGAVAPPFYLSGLVYDQLKLILTHRELGLNLLRMVHGEQEVIWHMPVRVGDSIRGRVFIKEIRDTPAGEMMTVSVQGIVKNRVAAEALMGFLVRGTGRRPAPVMRAAGEEPVREEVFRTEIRTWEGQQLSYAVVSGDNNFIHTSTFLAKVAGLPRTILHGVCFMAMCCSSLTRQLLADDLTRLKLIRGRFSAYVLPGQTLSLVGYTPLTRGEQPFAVFNGSGQAVMKNGLFIFR
ncbi:MAG: MaoC family dehydratase N-terminal domain-containing protein [Spirochaetes bacterium]|nr:MaoC family dehydratase N-terminal domain-containing protein [Spirochaetota bacterium]